LDDALAFIMQTVEGARATTHYQIAEHVHAITDFHYSAVNHDVCKITIDWAQQLHFVTPKGVEATNSENSIKFDLSYLDLDASKIALPKAVLNANSEGYESDTLKDFSLIDLEFARPPMLKNDGRFELWISNKSDLANRLLRAIKYAAERCPKPKELF
jgi:hypothetical protein